VVSSAAARQAFRWLSDSPNESTKIDRHVRSSSATWLPMSASSWSEEVQAEHLASFGPKLGPIYSFLSSEVMWLHTKWSDYMTLYAGGEARIRLLNDSSPRFFRMIQIVLWRDTLMHIARLTDPPHQRGGENLTLLSLPAAIEDDELRTRVDGLLESVLRASAFARDYRNKHLAHKDLDHALDRVAPLRPGSPRDVDDALGLFVKLLNEINSRYCDATMLYSDASRLSDTGLLLHWLALAQDVEARRRARVAAGTFTSEDLEYPTAP